jgi:hypothetical protein
MSSMHFESFRSELLLMSALLGWSGKEVVWKEGVYDRNMIDRKKGAWMT